MKIIYLIFLTAVGASLAIPAGQSGRSPGTYNQPREQSFENYLRGFLDTCSLTEDDFADAVDRVLAKAEAIDMDHTYVCDFIAEHFMDVMEPMIDMWDRNCNKRQPELGNISNVVALTLQSVSGYVCETDGKHLMELMHPCWRSDNTDEESVKECLDKVMRGYTMEDYVIVKNLKLLNYFCDAAGDVLDQCVKSKLDTRCKMEISREAFTGFIDAVINPCKKQRH